MYIIQSVAMFYTVIPYPPQKATTTEVAHLLNMLPQVFSNPSNLISTISIASKA